jgi:hypothetical protein
VTGASLRRRPAHFRNGRGGAAGVAGRITLAPVGDSRSAAAGAADGRRSSNSAASESASDTLTHQAKQKPAAVAPTGLRWVPRPISGALLPAASLRRTRAMQHGDLRARAHVVERMDRPARRGHAGSVWSVFLPSTAADPRGRRCTARSTPVAGLPRRRAILVPWRFPHRTPASVG